MKCLLLIEMRRLAFMHLSFCCKSAEMLSADRNAGQGFYFFLCFSGIDSANGLLIEMRNRLISINTLFSIAYASTEKRQKSFAPHLYQLKIEQHKRHQGKESQSYAPHLYLAIAFRHQRHRSRE